MTKKIIISILAIFVLLTSCKKKEATTVDFEKIDYQRTLFAVRADGSVNASCAIDIQLLFPNKFSNEGALKKIQQSILKQVFDSSYTNLNGKDAADKFTTATIENFKKAAKEIHSKKRSEDTIQINTIILYNAQSLLGYEIDRTKIKQNETVEEETTRFLMFDLKTGNRIIQSDIFQGDYKTKLAEMMKQKIITENGFNNEEDMINNGYFYSQNIVPNENFVVNENGISFIFNPYEIAAEALGQTQIDFSFNDLKPFLKTQSPISFLFMQEEKKK